MLSFRDDIQIINFHPQLFTGTTGQLKIEIVMKKLVMINMIGTDPVFNQHIRPFLSQNLTLITSNLMTTKFS